MRRRRTIVTAEYANVDVHGERLALGTMFGQGHGVRARQCNGRVHCIAKPVIVG